MNPSEICELPLSDLSGILRLNNAHAEETSCLDESGLRALLLTAIYARGVESGATAFLIALDETGNYTSPNFLWFKARYRSFVYIDRIIVAPRERGRGIAKRLYEDLFATAGRLGHARVVCEVNSYPPNPASEAFHRSLGFQEVGEAAIHGGAKTVCYLEKIIVQPTGLERRHELADETHST